MIITDFCGKHAEEARGLAALNYSEERARLALLPDIAPPELAGFADNGMGVAAFEGDSLVGYICAYEPWEHSFGTNAKGTFSPMHAHGAVSDNRGKIYMRMYQAAAEKWVSAGVNYHCLSMYANDSAAISALFTYGFGMRCVDAMRALSPISCRPRADVVFRRLGDEEKPRVRPLRTALSEHTGHSPCFMRSTPEEAAEHALRAEERALDIFVAEVGGVIAAFIDGSDSGENFAAEAPDTRNICGAYCLAEYRGGDIYPNLINYMIKYYAERGFARLGVDFESFNPTGNAFWRKHFTPYTCSLTRRIDEVWHARS